MTSMMGVTLNEDEKVEFTNDVMSSLIKMLVPVYQKHFTEQDLKDAIDLFKTPSLSKKKHFLINYHVVLFFCKSG